MGGCHQSPSFWTQAKGRKKSNFLLNSHGLLHLFYHHRFDLPIFTSLKSVFAAQKTTKNGEEFFPSGPSTDCALSLFLVLLRTLDVLTERFGLTEPLGDKFIIAHRMYVEKPMEKPWNKWWWIWILMGFKGDLMRHVMDLSSHWLLKSHLLATYSIISKTPIRKKTTGWWFGPFFFPYIGNVIIPTDLVFSGVGLNHQPDGYTLVNVAT